MVKSLIHKVRKRSGEIVLFNKSKIQTAIEKAFKAVEEKDLKPAIKLTEETISILNQRVSIFFQKIPNVEQIQNIVEEILSKSKYDRVAKAYMLYRRSRAHARELKEFFGVKDDLKFDVNAIQVLQERYLLRNKEGKIIETPTQLFKRIAKAIAIVEKDYSKSDSEIKKIEQEFFDIMINLKFLPNSPTLFNAGTSFPLLSACFVLPIEDSLEGIFDTLKTTALTQQRGGGTGFSFSKLRPKGDIVGSTKGIASGPVSFIKIFDATTETIKSGGKRRGANMAILHISHPDILEFIVSKKGSKQLSNFNISVAVDNKFLRAVKKNKDYHLINPRTKRVVSAINARKLFEFICKYAWETGDPGMIFIDEINKRHPLKKLAKIEATNPCGEQPLLPNESCNLGSINLSKFVKESKLDWGELKKTIKIGVRFLDNVIDANKYPTKEIENMTKANRKIGLGIMGWADTLVELGIKYDTKDALKFADKLMKFFSTIAIQESLRLGKEKGSFPNFQRSTWAKDFSTIRNSTVTTIAPTGTIGIIAGCSSGIEPLFAIAYVREVMEGKKLFEVNKNFQKIALKKGFYSENLIKRVAKKGNLEGINLPKQIKDLFRTALQINPEWHIKIQATFQKYVDNAVSKTINLPQNATVKDIEKAYLLAANLKCKGITVYRYGSKPAQVLYLGEKGSYTKATKEYSGGTCIGSVCTF